MIKAILFDLDGTIGDTLPLCIKAFKSSIEPMLDRTVSEDEIISKFGPSEEGVILSFLNDRYSEGIEKYLFYYEKYHYITQTPYDGITDIISYLKSKNVIVGIVTGKGKYSTDITLNKYKLIEYFDVIETGSPYGPRKVEALKNILSIYNLDSSEAIYIGDSISDILDAKTLNITVYAACWGCVNYYENLKQLNPDNIFIDVNSLFKNLIQIFG